MSGGMYYKIEQEVPAFTWPRADLPHSDQTQVPAHLHHQEPKTPKGTAVLDIATAVQTRWNFSQEV